ncbi:MAG TPA: SDR family NAD(P)-dependent oxidoreductase [Actinocatenispora sp.]
MDLSYPGATMTGMDLTDTVAVVTGAAVGIGRALARRLAAAGATVVAADIDPVGGAHTVELIGGRAVFVRADMRVEADIAALVDAAVATGPVRVLVNNAGGGPGPAARFPEGSSAAWGAVLDANLRGAMLATQLVLGPMRAAGGGAVVNVASTAGLGPAPHPWPEYAVAKAGLIRLTECLAPLRQQAGVRVNCVVPDWVGTDRAYAELAAMGPAERAAAPPLVPLPELADAVLRLCTDESLAGRVLVLRPPAPPRLLPAV